MSKQLQKAHRQRDAAMTATNDMRDLVARQIVRIGKLSASVAEGAKVILELSAELTKYAKGYDDMREIALEAWNITDEGFCSDTIMDKISKATIPEEQT